MAGGTGDIAFRMAAKGAAVTVADINPAMLGVGMELYVEGTGPGPYEGGHVQVLGSGKVLVSTGLTTQGQGHETSFAQIVASELGVPIEDCLVVEDSGTGLAAGRAAGARVAMLHRDDGDLRLNDLAELARMLEEARS